MHLNEITNEVFQADKQIVKLSNREVEFLKERVKHAPRGRVRLCAHPSNDDVLHEMIIVLVGETYIRPHKHLHKSESFHIIEGVADVVALDDSGKIFDVIELGDLASSRQFFYRLSRPVYHTLLIRSPVFVVHETTNGPFKQGDALFAPWAPAESSPEAKEYLRTLEGAVAAFTAHQPTSA